ncbi:hypothetical protein P1X14_03735 [Sphingomonas sp. AOB5]|uniref:hypothetical protein n=1 Tax=Sphingomonas sp. AOB5 TaxID=3034017 RepID=UPI0023F967B7|nr:hypothetical protein [Sphingomonas sp. AOB5]MDF7774347.1 hypothetical protein [Sphingomonas sp. AOB5]
MLKPLAIGIAACLIVTPALAQRGGRTIASNDRSLASVDLSGAATPRTWAFFRHFAQPRYLRDTSNCEAGIAAFEGQRRDFEAFVDRFLAGPVDAKKTGLERARYLRAAATAHDEVRRWEDIMKGETDSCTVRSARMEILSRRSFVAAISRVFPDMAEARTVLAAIESSLAAAGSDNQAAARAGENRNAAIASVRLPPARSTNPAWQKRFRDWFEANHPDYVFIRQGIYNADWFIKHNPVTSVPEYRQIGTRIAFRMPDGRCRFMTLDLFEYHQGGGSYGSPKFTPGRQEDILCENVDPM